MYVNGAPLIEMVDVGKLYGNIRALQGISLKVGAGEVTCVLGDNGAGKPSLIKIMAGVHQHDEGSYKVEGQEVRFGSPREALNRGIATVYQDLAVVPLMSVWRNFFLGNEPTRGRGILERLDVRTAQRVMREEMAKMATAQQQYAMGSQAIQYQAQMLSIANQIKP